jgi:tetratricopeptide (TPR) repeat protein
MNTTLPLDMLGRGVQSLVSCDGQIYLGCRECSRESRIHYQWAGDPARFPEGVCGSCGSKLDEFILHLNQDVYRCLDLDHRFETESAGFETPSCSICGSYDLELLATDIVPPFPGSFDQVAPERSQPWGLSLMEDLEQMRYELSLSAHSLDFASHLLLNVRFCERLRLANDYQSESTDIPLLNEEANLFLEHCKRTSSLDTGLRALALFEYLVESQDEAAAMDHYIIAIASDVLLVRFSEMELAYAGRTTLRADAVQHARSAVALAGKKAASDPTALLNVSKTEVLLSRLLSFGNSSADEKREAIAIADRVLERNVLALDGADDVRIARAITIASLPDVDSTLLDEAIRVLEQNSDLLRKSGEMERLKRILFNLGLLYQLRGKLEDGIRVLNEAAAIARRELVQAGDADMLAERGDRYLVIFETLASALAQAGRGREALTAYETLRGAVPRLTNDEDLRTVTAVRAVMSMLGEIAEQDTPDREPLDPVEFISPNVDSELAKIQSALLDAQTVLIYYGLASERVTALLIYSGSDGQTHVDPIQWAYATDWTRAADEAVLRALTGAPAVFDTKLPALLNAAVYGSPSPLRNKRLTIASWEAYRDFFAPIEDRLHSLGARRLAICAAGMLSSVSFETISDRKRPGWFLANDFDVCYLPSVGLASGFTGYGQSEKSLLMIGYSGQDIPGVDDEIEAIRIAWRGEYKIVHGSKLNKLLALKELAKEYDFIHFAGHGVFDYDDPLKSAFYFGSGASDQLVADAHRLTAEDLLSVRMPKHPVVTLSACSSGVTSYDGAHRLTGLPGSLLQSGARTIIATRWPVADSTALELMRHFYTAVAEGSTPFAAFTQAQGHLRATEPLEKWGAFSYLGIP